MTIRFLISFVLFAISSPIFAQIRTLGDSVTYKVETSATASSGDFAPLWLSANRYGLSSVEPTSGYLRVAVERPIEADTCRIWRVGYGADLVAAAGHTTYFFPHQLYADVEYRMLRLELGQKERKLPMMNDELSTGGLTMSNNACPVPQVRAGIPNWCNISGRSHFLAVKGHVAYGMFTDGRWQKEFVTTQDAAKLYAQRVLYHSKAIYFRIGRPERFPLTGSFGLEMVTQFGGDIWNLNDRGGTGNVDFQSHQKMSTGIKDFWHALIPGGNDVTDGAYANAAGNHLGSWVFSLDWNASKWGLRAYYDHFFEDHSQMFFQYGWRDHLLGVEARMPRNPYVSTIVYEHINTTDQSGAVYHDVTTELPYPVYGRDQYYMHNIYGAYQHWGQTMGNPLIIGPIYNDDHVDEQHQYTLFPLHNRIQAHHVGLNGRPTAEISWRLLFTHQRSLGSYNLNIEDAKATHLFFEASYAPQRLKNWAFGLGLAHTGGSMMSQSQGLQVSVRKTGAISRRHKK